MELPPSKGKSYYSLIGLYQRKQGQQITYNEDEREDDLQNTTDSSKENSEPNKKTPQKQILVTEPKAIQNQPAKLNEEKSLTLIQKQVPKQVSDIEKNLWKNNIKYGERKKKDYLDISNEDFSKIFTSNIEGKQVNPSTFNIFRDSLSKTSATLNQRLIASLPELNPDEASS